VGGSEEKKTHLKASAEIFGLCVGQSVADSQQENVHAKRHLPWGSGNETSPLVQPWFTPPRSAQGRLRLQVGGDEKQTHQPPASPSAGLEVEKVY
jgi:hypothetical protein